MRLLCSLRSGEEGLGCRIVRGELVSLEGLSLSMLMAEGGW